MLFLWKSWIRQLDYAVKGLLVYVKIIRKMVGIYGKMGKLGSCSGNFIFLCRVFKGEFYGGDKRVEMVWIKIRKNGIRILSGN